jgi:hypothetical protein
VSWPPDNTENDDLEIDSANGASCVCPTNLQALRIQAKQSTGNIKETCATDVRLGTCAGVPDAGAGGAAGVGITVDGDGLPAGTGAGSEPECAVVSHTNTCGESECVTTMWGARGTLRNLLISPVWIIFFFISRRGDMVFSVNRPAKRVANVTRVQIGCSLLSTY